MKNFNDLIADAENLWDEAEEEIPEYEIIAGNENIVFIKAGADESIPGFENKYQKMAERIHEKMGATVIYASNPDEPHEEIDKQKIRDIVSEQGFESFKLYLWGTSDGGDQTLKLAKKFSETKKWIGVNSSFINFEDFVEKLQSLPYVKKLLFYGTKDDDSYELFPDLHDYENDNLKIIMVEGATHSFKGMLPEFIQTIDWLGEEDEK